MSREKSEKKRNHAAVEGRLEDHLGLLRCHYNFLRPHRALKFAREVRTPAMQAGLTKTRLTFRDVFMSVPNFPINAND